ncbi:hypothetical protein J4Q44_G00228000 [Coregonus suidteri]|uniref:Uncharacterized protein n=1 Tax=Coregonus suidteri TaxID=861788 RepID=A0AAN8L8Q7_9TELE
MWQELDLWPKGGHVRIPGWALEETGGIDLTTGGLLGSQYSPTVGPLSKALNLTTCSPSRGAALQFEPVLVLTVCVSSAVWRG